MTRETVAVTRDADGSARVAPMGKHQCETGTVVSRRADGV